MNQLAEDLVDVGHVLEDGMITYKGLPAPTICDYLNREASRSHYAPGTVIVGIDSLNIDDTVDGSRPVHTTLLHNEIPNVERLANLAVLPEGGLRFFAVPVKVRAFCAFSVRAFGVMACVVHRLQLSA